MKKRTVIDTINQCQKRLKNQVNPCIDIEFLGFAEAMYNGTFSINDLWGAGARRLASAIDADILLKMYEKV